ncbi:TonB-dependent receptor plug domain-containing protein [Melioribacteraceae bacterium 4301-Me]|uniref:TonB-dependent receptor plug domain-containing protein n=1 Tax=Pyranulibacter aquaticus TaxID=3163344 RepID=UPI0035949E64
MKKIYICLFLLLFSATSFPQSDTLKTTLSEIIVTANRTETPYYTLASSVSVLTQKDLKERQINTVVDALRELPGVTVVEQGGPGKLASVFIRGASPNHTLVLIDGTEMNNPSSPDNAFDFSYLNVNDIDKIEIVRGPQSTLYGSEAIAGVINIITKFGSPNKNFSFYGEGGSNNYYRGNVSAYGNYNKLNYFLSFSRNKTDGISAADSKYGNTEKDGYSNNSFTGKIMIHPNNNFNSSFLYKYTKSNNDLDQNEKLGDDPNFSYKVEEQLFSSISKLELFNKKWKQSLTASIMKRISKAVDLPDEIRPNTSSNNYANGVRYSIDWQNNFYFLSNNLITVGIEHKTEKASSNYSSTSIFGPYQSIFPEQSVYTNSLYAQDQINVFNKLFTSVGLRYDNHQKFGGELTYRITQAFYFDKIKTKFKATYGTGFKAPSLFYLFDPAYGNPSLKPEKSKGYDFGVEQFLLGGKLSFELNYYSLMLTDMFSFDENFKAINVAKASMKGIEFNLTGYRINRFNFSINYTLTNTKDEYVKSTDYNLPLLRRPKNQAFLLVGYDFNTDVNLQLQVKYVGERYDKDFTTYPAQRTKLSSYTIVNLLSSIKISDNLEFYGRIQNLFNANYEEVLYYGTLGRTFYLGAGINL